MSLRLVLLLEPAFSDSICGTLKRGLPWFEEPKITKVQKKPAEAKLEPEFVYGFDNDLMLAWKVDINSMKKEKIMSMQLERPSNPAAHSAMRATWPDGDSKEVSECSCKDYEGKTRQSSTMPSNKFWSGTHIVTHHSLCLKVKPDRSPIMILLEQKRQILQVAISLFNSEEAAGQFMQAIGELYAADKITRDGLKEHRDNELAAQGLKPGRKRCDSTEGQAINLVSCIVALCFEVYLV